MEIRMALVAVDSTSLLQQYVGIKMLNNIKQIETSQMTTMLADFALAQPVTPNIPIPASLQVGQNLDISI